MTNKHLKILLGATIVNSVGITILFLILTVSAWAYVAYHFSIQDQKANHSATEKAHSETLRLKWDTVNAEKQKAAQISSQLFLGKFLVTWEEGEKEKLIRYSGGSSFLVRYNNRNYVISAWHMFRSIGFEKEKLQTANLITVLGTERIYLNGMDVYMDPQADIIVGKVSDDLKVDLELDENLELTMGMPITIYGYPDGDFMMSEGNITGIWSTMTIFKCLIYFGNSGGPITTEVNGKKLLVGMSVKYDPGQSLAYSPPLKRIIQDIQTLNHIQGIK